MVLITRNDYSYFTKLEDYGLCDKIVNVIP